MSSCKIVLRVTNMFVIFIVYFTLFVTIQYFVAGQCNPDNSTFNQSLALAKCTEKDKHETLLAGVIITDNFILTASKLPADGIPCVITYNLDGKHREQTTESLGIRIYLSEQNIDPNSLPQVQLLELNPPIIFELPGYIPDIILAETMKLAKRRPKIRENATLHTIREKDNQYDVVQMEVKFASRVECEKENEHLHPHVFCITIVEGGCDGCKDVKAGSALVQNDGLIGIVSERQSCDPSKMILCANVYEVRKWIESNVNVGGFWPWSWAGNGNNVTTIAWQHNVCLAQEALSYTGCERDGSIMDKRDHMHS
ncbi:hypothetical protein GQX74_000674 [Glossina fuscipes]|nr:hypothetical protein GQX74_000674 [Glossina fuscipes]